MATATRAKSKTIETRSTIAARSASARPSRPRPLLLTAAQYLKMADLGFFRETRVELVNGSVIEMTAMNDSHWFSLIKCGKTLRTGFESSFEIVSQVPLAIDEYSEPEPDFFVMSALPQSKADALPLTVLVIEISDSTLQYDRTTKAALYASAGISEYWIVNLNAREVEVRRAPNNQKYSQVQTFNEKETVSPLAAPRKKLKVTDLLP
ncbi:MAG TPA: Uma2 family endonuclease [Abditibacteriaceae bacterium]|jgi:Uma2 family endonuclease